MNMRDGGCVGGIEEGTRVREKVLTVISRFYIFNINFSHQYLLSN